MGTFFVSWELWQEMTFVLGCGIVIVFWLGLIRLWRSNRLMRKLEALDTEQNARRSEMSYCGIETWEADDIPFGVRAIQRGVEVEGIWISRSDHSDFTQLASSATFTGDQEDYSKRRGTIPERNFDGQQQEGSASEPVAASMSNPPVQPQLPLTAGPWRLRRPHCGSNEPQEPTNTPRRPDPESYIPSGVQIQQLRGHLHHFPTTETPLESEHPPVTPTQAGPMEERMVYGAARIRANRYIRRPNMGFEILPAGALGPRQELQSSSDGSQDAGSNQLRNEHTRPPRARLRKKPPISQLRAKFPSRNSI